MKDSIAAGYKIMQDANLQQFAEKIGCKRSTSNTVLQTNLAQATLIKPSVLLMRKKAIVTLRHSLHGPWNTYFSRIAEIEKEVVPFFEKGSKDKDSLENDSIAQLSFQDEYFKCLNHAPFIIFAIAIFKIWVVPAMTLLTPIVAWVLPYILLRFVYAFPIEQQEYLQTLQNMWLGNIGTNTTGDMLSPRSIGQFMIFGFTFAQSMVQPIQNALHLYKTDSILFEMGVKLLELYGILQTLKAEAKKQGVQMHISETLSELEGLDPRRAFLLIKEDPERLHMAFRDLAQLEIVWRIAKTDYLNTVIFHPKVFQIRDMVDVSLTNGVPSSITLSTDTERHAILTGPNGGGKSSVLRGILQSVLLAHTYGVAPAVDAIMPRFRWIASGLQLRDTPGVYSMFETEVKFAAECIRSGSPEGMGLVLFDELFHSTNPPDGTRSAKLFLEQLWTSNVFSIVSTHVFPLVEDRPGHVRAICCAASEKPDGDIQYSYRAEPGICKVSSVHKVWEKYGLRRAAHNPMAKSL